MSSPAPGDRPAVPVTDLPASLFDEVISDQGHTSRKGATGIGRKATH